MNRSGKLFASFSPLVSKRATKSMCLTERCWKLDLRNDLALEKIVKWTRSALQVWVNYYERFNSSVLLEALRTVDKFIIRWAKRKYKSLRGHHKRTWDWLLGVKSRQPNLFAQWLNGKNGWAIGAYEPRGSSTVLGAREVELPSCYSTFLVRDLSPLEMSQR